MDRNEAIRNLLSAIDAYLGRFDLQGVRDVRAGMARFGHGDIRDVAPSRAPAVDHLDHALAATAEHGEPELAKAIANANAFLPWIAYDLYPRDEIGEAFADGHAFASILGEGALIEAEDFDLGIFLIAPHVFYRDHHHAAPELYAPLTGPHGWRFGPGRPIAWKQAHQPVWNEPWASHATLVGDIPFLCIFGWTRDVGEPARVMAAGDWGAIERLRPVP